MPIFPIPEASFPFDYARTPDEGQPHIQEVILSGLNWSNDLTAVVNLASASWAPQSRFAGGDAVAVRNRPGLSIIQSMFIDNTRCIGPCIISFPDTGFSVTVPPFSQQWVNVVTRLTIFSIEVASSISLPKVYACNVTVFPSSQVAREPVIQRRVIQFTTNVAADRSTVTTNDFNSVVITTTAIGATTYSWSDTLGNSGNTDIDPNERVFFTLSATPLTPIRLDYAAGGVGGAAGNSTRVILDGNQIANFASGAPASYVAPTTDRITGSVLILRASGDAILFANNTNIPGVQTATYTLTAQFF